MVSNKEIKKCVDNLKFDFLKKVKNNLLLTQAEIDILKLYGFDYHNYANMNELLNDLNDYLNEFNEEELEYLYSKLEERNYYENINK